VRTYREVRKEERNKVHEGEKKARNRYKGVWRGACPGDCNREQGIEDKAANLNLEKGNIQ
jgi:hypothetical protein